VTTIVAGVIGAVLGAVFTAASTWWLSVRLDSLRADRRLQSAIGIVVQELQENSRRVAKSHNSARARLTLGDWLANKESLAGLVGRNRDLWSDLAETYEMISDYATAGADEPPTVPTLDDLVTRLSDEYGTLDKDIKRIRSRPWG
jgi:hypothetical protein